MVSVLVVRVIKVKLALWSSWIWWSGWSKSNWHSGQVDFGGQGAQEVRVVGVLRWSGWSGCSGGWGDSLHTDWHKSYLFHSVLCTMTKKDILQTQILVSYAFRKWFLMQCLQKDQNSCSGDALNNVKCDNPQNDLQFSNISLLYLKTSLLYPSPFILKYSHLLSGRCVWFSPMRPAVWLVTPHHIMCFTVSHSLSHSVSHMTAPFHLQIISCFLLSPLVMTGDHPRTFNDDQP